MPRTLHSHTCQRCGKVTRTKNLTQAFCSRSCARQAKRKVTACKGCGEVFDPRPNQSYCSVRCKKLVLWSSGSSSHKIIQAVRLGWDRFGPICVVRSSMGSELGYFTSIAVFSDESSAVSRAKEITEANRAGAAA